MYKIALLNPYLFAGHTKTAEIECTAKFIEAANRLNNQVKVFSSSDDIYYYKPDFVVTISFQTPKLTPYPTYVVQDVPVSMMVKVPRFIRNILSYDGYLAISPTVKTWLEQSCAENGKNFHISDTAIFSVPKTDYKDCHYEKAIAMYIGTNWDGLRHNSVFHYLESGDYVQCHGPSEKWANYSKSLYAGEIPFDGKSVLDAYTKFGAGLCIGHPLFDNENIPNSRIFEIIAASAMPICSSIDLYKSMYGDTVLYVDHTLPAVQLAEQIKSSVQWIRDNPSKAKEMTRAAHDIFTQKFTMEVFINNMIDMHTNVLKDNHYKTNVAYQNQQIDKKPSVEGVVSLLLFTKHIDNKLNLLLKDLENQDYKNFHVLIITEDHVDEVCDEIKKYNFNFTFINSIDDTNKKISDTLDAKQTTWVSILNASDRLFPNHLSLLIASTYKDYDLEEPIAAVFSGSTEYSDYFYLPEKIHDEHKVANKEKIRMGYLEFDYEIPLVSVLFNYQVIGQQLLSQNDFGQLNSSALIKNACELGAFIRTCEVTCSSLMYVKDEVNEIINELKIKNEELRHHNNELNKQLAEKNAHITNIYRSRSWKYTAPMRKVLSLLKSAD